jgi:hypothetical protein
LPGDTADQGIEGSESAAFLPGSDRESRRTAEGPEDEEKEREPRFARKGVGQGQQYQDCGEGQADVEQGKMAELREGYPCCEGERNQHHISRLDHNE